MPEDSLTRCIEEICQEPPGSLPTDPPLLDEWLSSVGLKRVKVADPARFSMAGRFLARYEHGWAVAFGVPPGPIFDPANEAVGGGPLLEACVLAPLELPRTGRNAPSTGSGRVELIAIASEAEGPMRSLGSARAIAHRGLAGDRYAASEGTFSTKVGSGRDLTLVDTDVLRSLSAQNVEIDPLDARRNLVVSGIDLDGLIGRRFRIGSVECSGARRCEPCAHLQRLTVPGVLRGLVHCGGLRADILSDGEISVGDEIVARDD
jgi:MOSC domain-containing protein YiiM